MASIRPFRAWRDNSFAVRSNLGPTDLFDAPRDINGHIRTRQVFRPGCAFYALD